MMNFKDQIEQDIKNVFHNSSEFAEIKEICYNGKYYKIPVIMDYEGAKERKKLSSDNADGIFLSDATMYISHKDFRVIPRKGQQIEIGEDIFTIVKVSNEMGEIILDLEMFDE